MDDAVHMVNELIARTDEPLHLYGAFTSALWHEGGGLELHHTAAWVVAVNVEEASRLARVLAVKNWPQAEQWAAQAEPVPDDVVLLVAARIAAIMKRGL